MDTLVYRGSLVISTCWCGIRHAMPRELYDEATFNGMATYCPLGHSGVFKDSDRSRLEKENAHLHARIVHVSDQRAAAERSRAALKGHLTRLRKRLINGVCPWCSRYFTSVERHVRTKHPEQLAKMDEALA